MTKTATDWEIIIAMDKYGGSFVHALAMACSAADPENFDRIKQAFPELWDEYRDIVELRDQRERIFSGSRCTASSFKLNG